MNYIKKKNPKFLAAIIATLLLVSIATAVIPPTLAISAPTLSASSGNVGDEITVSGTDAEPGSVVAIYWENINPINLLATTFADGLGVYSQQVTIPQGYAGTHYIIVLDLSGTAAAAFTVEPKIFLAPTQGLPNDPVTVAGTGFAPESTITLTFDSTPLATSPATVMTDSKGSFVASFNVPSNPYGDYTVEATDSLTNSATATFTIAPVIVLDQSSGPSGSVICVCGRGFLPSTGIAFFIDSTSVPEVWPIVTNADGAFCGKIIIPSVPVGSYNISAINDIEDGDVGALAPFCVTATTSITLSPTAGEPDSCVRISGQYFTAIPGIKVTVRIGLFTLGTYCTDENGAFEGKFRVPDFYPDVYTVNATDCYNLTAVANYQIALTELAVIPTCGVTGSTVTVIGYGFTGDTANVKIDNIQVLSSITVASLLGGVDFIVPTLPVGRHCVTATDDDGLSASTLFTVTATSKVILYPSCTQPDSTVNVMAQWFQPDTSLTFTMKNSTWSTIVSVTPSTGFSGTTTNSLGTYRGTFEVPLSWGFGNYILNVTGPNGLTVEVPFKIIPMCITVDTREPQYVQGEMGSFIVFSNADTPGSITITDPYGFTFDVLPVVLTADGFFYVDAYIMFELPNDAPVGTWTWTAVFTAHGGYTATGSFVVVSPPVGPASGGSGSSTTGDSGSTGSTDTGTTDTTGSTDTGTQGSTSGSSSTTSSTTSAQTASQPKANKDTTPNTEEPQTDQKDPSSTKEKEPPTTEPTADLTLANIVLMAMIAGAAVGLAIIGLRWRGIKSPAVEQSMPANV